MRAKRHDCRGQMTPSEPKPPTKSSGGLSLDETIKTSVAVLKELLKSVPGTLIIGGIVISVSAVTLPFLIPSLAKMPDKVTWILFGFGIVVTATGIYL
jgi:hypothetical protein